MAYDTTIRRVPDRGQYDRETIDSIIDEALVAHVGTVRDGVPIVIPMFCVRDGDDILLHGAPAAGVLRRAGSEGSTICVEMTLLDGLVLARSAFHHSMNYRSVVVLGVPAEVVDPDKKAAALDAFTDRLVPGRLDDLRPMTKKEVRGTSVFRLSLDSASAKIRTGPPVDDDEDYELDIWAGVVPVARTFGAAVGDPRNRPNVTVPQNVRDLQS